VNYPTDIGESHKAYNHDLLPMDIYILSAFSKSKDSRRALKHPLVKGYFYKPVTRAELNVVMNV
jgi:hypothetical protein